MKLRLMYSIYERSTDTKVANYYIDPTGLTTNKMEIEARKKFNSICNERNLDLTEHSYSFTRSNFTK